MSDTLIRTETRTDFLGEYTAYIYSDGHVETDPNDRPVSKEDYQRRRANSLAAADTATAVTSARIANATGRDHLNRDQAASSATAGLLDEVRKTLKAVGTLIETTAAPVDQVQSLIETVPLGGTLVSDVDTLVFDPLVTDTALRELR